MDNYRKLVSIIIPVFNEEGNIPVIYKELLKVWGILWNKYEYEIIFVNDGSSDKSGQIIRNIVRQNRRVRYIEFSRNFGKEIATTAGLQHSHGHAVIMLDADLQHPPELIPQFVAKWEEGNEVVIGVRNSIKSDTIKKIGSSIFYKVINTIGSDINLMPFATDFRLMDRKVVNEFNRFTERARMTRGLVNWLGFKREFIYFDAPVRNSGKAGYSFLKLVKLALSSIVSHSMFPLKLAGYLGVLIVFTVGPLGFYVLLGKYFFDWSYANSFSGTAQLAFLTIFLVGVVLSCLGLTALYIANIYGEVIGRPMYVIREKNNID
jgi:dolichol-phosphate mannosyltransferase